MSVIQQVASLILTQPWYQITPEETEKIWSGELDPESEEFQNDLKERSEKALEEHFKRFPKEKS